MTGLYVHVPFCKSKCPYCDFLSFIDSEPISEYLRALRCEAQRRGQGRELIDTVYIGGGTPSVLTPSQITELFSHLSQTFTIHDDAEVTVELNPDDVTEGIIGALRDIGANRLSLGVQSFDDAALRALGRRHTASSACRAIESIRKQPWADLSIDIMFGWSFQTEQLHRDTLERAVSFEPGHISCYQLTVEGETPFSARRARGEELVVDDERARHLFLLSHDVLTSAGYEHYEVSNYASPGHESVHNLSYWRHTRYIGLGPSAHSFDGVRRRSWNVPDLQAYIEGARTSGSAVGGVEDLTDEQLRLERLMLGFRTAEGVDEAVLASIDGATSVISKLVDEGLCRRVRGRVVPTLDGLLVSDGLPLRFNLS